jgi:hypothetical protein
MKMNFLTWRNPPEQTIVPSSREILRQAGFHLHDWMSGEAYCCPLDGKGKNDIDAIDEALNALGGVVPIANNSFVVRRFTPEKTENPVFIELRSIMQNEPHPARQPALRLWNSIRRFVH